ncbi:GNAT family N-acetyltransferase [Microbacterium sp. EYE_5]|uniref:GNAT family N-acetyltransferase n=1 Tax=unclassified Microbacterium TaxID=2609290 RepID=UPI0020053A64|nr:MULTISPECIES: GNAT family N-acetyltransferase [unclassified Microbacterium]MCK6081733.1 GNAT family N-acetyltransferase [Microbacterium sp. EYE_382]MCK6087003.1 GNAT family N-acetyltransferase [Microbacterium sp. EYE_384]MCK6125019.1 GNAT family N-acetyltransferase [Microbacterium sp. EYE_80]MCK6127766.1 GNAT family N-acetyltransferase [Microbacterium sp. EYE_79]MCK6142687.1 GNAT family N-acetyltransferase [Microbacterium sp. EYE_39]
MSASNLARRLDHTSEPGLPTHPEITTWRPASAPDIDAIHALTAAADAVDHPTWLTPRQDVAEIFQTSHIDPARDTLVGFAADGTLVATGTATLHPSRVGGLLSVDISGTVHPDWRRRGIGTALTAWLDARAQQQVAAASASLDDGGTEGRLKAYAEETNADQAAVLTARGYTPERWFSTMERDLADAVPPIAAPDGITLVAYDRDRDADALAARNDAFRDHWGSLPSNEERWQQFVGGDFFRPDLSRVAVTSEGAIVAFCLASVNEEDFAALGASHAYIDLIGVVRSHRRRGLAPLVVSAALEAIRADGLERAVLDVDTDSPTGANRLYEGLGFSATERVVAFVRHL